VGAGAPIRRPDLMALESGIPPSPSERRLTYHLTDSVQGYGGLQHSIRRESFELSSNKKTNVGIGLSAWF
jgi:hypothetical protein